MAAAREEPSGANYHEWRKRAKYLWYQCRALRGVWRPMMDACCRQLHNLSDLLGEDHDLVVFEEILGAEGQALAPAGQSGILGEAISRHHDRLRKAARKLGRRIYAEKPSAFRLRMGTYWRAWR
jgi:CHAD domain-containing protein